MQVKPQVFISYCRSDGARFATQLREKLEKENPEITLWQDVISERGGRDWWLQITEALDHVKYMVLVLTPDALKSLTVRKEWRYARQKGVCVYPILGSDKLDFNVLPRWIRDLHIDELGYDRATQAFASEGHWRKFINQLQSPCETQRVPFMAEELPENFVQRPREFERLIGLLQDTTRQEPIAITAALEGAGGFGKTTLAKALCHDERIQEAFDDGILWTTLGENPGDLTGKLVDLIEVLSGDRPGFKDPEPASALLSQLLADRDILMVVDDVWDFAHLRPFLNGGKRCARLITTRNRQTVPSAALPVNVDAMQQNEAVQLLAARTNARREHMRHLQSLAEKLGEWPLLLRLVNALLQTRVNQRQSLAAAIDYAEKALSRRGLTAFDAKDSNARDQAVAKTLAVSLELLTAEENARFFELAIFPEDTDIPLATVAQLWQATAGLDEFDAEGFCSRLRELSLLLDFDLTTRYIRLHDVMRKFLEGQLSNASSVHAKLIDAWRDPHQLPDSYAWHFIAYHLARCDRLDHLHRLLLDFHWIQAKLNATDITSLISDYDFLSSHDVECATLQASLQLSAHVLANKAATTQLAGQLLGRLLNINSSSMALLDQAAQSRNGLWVRPITGTLISPAGALRFTLADHSGWVSAVAITVDGGHAVSASDDNTLKVWEVKTGRLLHTLKGHSDGVSAVAIAADGGHAVSASSDKTLKVWEVKTGRLLHTLEGHSSGVRAVTITADGGHAVSASSDKTLKVWEVKTGRLLRTLEGHSSGVSAVAVTADGGHAVSASSDKTLKVWEVKTGRLLHTLEGHSGGVSAVAITADGGHAVSASDDNTLKVWEAKTGRLLHTLEGHSGGVSAVAITADGGHAVSASDDNTLKVWEVKTGRLLHTLEGHSGGVSAVAITADGGHAVSASYDNTLKVWKVKTGRLLYTLEGHSSGASAVAITADGGHAVSASYDNTLKVWKVKTGRLLHTLEGHSSGVRAVAITADGGHAVSASADKTLKVWEVKTGRLLHTLEGHSGGVRAVAITADGGHAVSASYDNTLKVWEVKTGRLLHTLEGHSGGVNAVAITADGGHAVSASSDNTLKVWEAKTGRLLATFTADCALTDCALASPQAIAVAGDILGHVHFLKIEQPRQH